MGQARGARPVEALLCDVLPAARLGEAWALTVVYEQLAPAVLGYLRSRGARDPEDLTSEVFVAVLPRLPALTGGVAGLRTLVFSVAHARLVDDLRRRSRRPEAVGYVPELDPRTTRSSEDVAIDNVQDAAVREALAGLSEEQRDVLLLRVVADLTVDQVAAALGKSAGAVKQLQRRGLLALRERVADGRVTL